MHYDEGDGSDRHVQRRIAPTSRQQFHGQKFVSTVQSLLTARARSGRPRHDDWKRKGGYHDNVVAYHARI